MSDRLHELIHKLKHFLPAQAPLKDFIHHNTLHAFQDQNFFEAITQASHIFGYKVTFSPQEYLDLYHQGKIRENILDKILSEKYSPQEASDLKQKMLGGNYVLSLQGRIGRLREEWKNKYKINLNKQTHPLVFRLAGAYLDQGISIWSFPRAKEGFFQSVLNLDAQSYSRIFHSSRVQGLIREKKYALEDLLEILVGNPDLYETYLFDQQFAHPGWSGIISVIEDKPETLLDPRTISLEDFIRLELLGEIDYLDQRFGKIWSPLGRVAEVQDWNLFSPVEMQEVDLLLSLWQQAYEWTYYDEVLSAFKVQPKHARVRNVQSGFQAVFCLDDRECSIRRYVEQYGPDSRTYGTAGFFNVECYFQPEGGKFLTKICPAPVSPAYIIRETGQSGGNVRDLHFSKHTKGFVSGWLSSQTMGFWSALKLLGNVFYPAESPAMVSAFRHMDANGKLEILSSGERDTHTHLHYGFTLDEMADRIEALLRSIGMTSDFSPLVYFVGHGASSINNTHYAGYDCGACSGRAGSVNARVAAQMANTAEVRSRLADRGIHIPKEVVFIGALHDTTRDEIAFFDCNQLPDEIAAKHTAHVNIFHKALSDNARERSRRFMLTDSDQPAEKVHAQVKKRALSLFEPRPELNHATNALCIVGRRSFSEHIFLDRRAFLNSYDPGSDPEGKLLTGILNAVAPVCGGINLEYYFSRVDPYRLGAGTKLPHNVMGLVGVTNGIEGDLRPGLPTQMTEVHDPVRLMVIVEQKPEIILKAIQVNPRTYEWFIHAWIHLVSIDPENRQQYYFRQGVFEKYEPLSSKPVYAENLSRMIETTQDNLPVMILTEQVWN